MLFVKQKIERIIHVIHQFIGEIYMKFICIGTSFNKTVIIFYLNLPVYS